MAGSSQSTDSSSHTETNPWKPTIPVLNNLIGQVSGQLGNSTPTPYENDALSGLLSNALAGNRFAPDISQLAYNTLTGKYGNNGIDETSYVRQGYNDARAGLEPVASQSTNPYDNPVFQNLVNTITSDTNNSIRSQYAGAGYSPTSAGDFSQTLGRGISQGIAPAFVDAQNNLTNQRIAAANGLFGASAGTSGLTQNIDMNRMNGMAGGIGLSGDALNAADSPYSRVMQVEAMRRGLPLENIGALENLIVPMAGLGGTTDFTGHSTTRSNPSLLSTLGGISGLFGGGGIGGMGLGLLGMSDRRMKEDIEEVGKLNDGTKIYRFRYKGHPTTFIGVMAQDIEKTNPDAVKEIGGIKFVDYRKATERAVRAA